MRCGACAPLSGVCSVFPTGQGLACPNLAQTKACQSVPCQPSITLLSTNRAASGTRQGITTIH
jgi:hypothetical protein